MGQLFLITFTGPEAGASSSASGLIYDLIVNHHIGGVVLEADNNNFMGQDQTIPTLVSLTDQIQRNEYNASLLPQKIRLPMSNSLPPLSLYSLLSARMEMAIHMINCSAV